MKTHYTLILIVLFCIPARAQTTDAQPARGLRWYVSPVGHISSVNGKAALFEGFEAAWIANDHLTIGLEASQLETDIKADVPGPEGSEFIYMWYGGVTAEYGIRPAPRLRVAARALVGGGEAHWRDTSDNLFFGNREKDVDHTTSIVLEPGFRASYAFTSWLQATAGVSYRYVGGGSSSAASQADMRNFAGTIGLRLGRF